MQLICYFILLAIVPCHLEAARILSIFAVPLASQYAFIEPLLRELAGRGHQITSISNYPQQPGLRNFRDIVVEKNEHLLDEYQNFSIENIDLNYYDTIYEIYHRASRICINILNDPAVREIMKSETYDLIILDVVYSESFYGMSEYFQAPIVGVSSYGAIISVDELVGNISPLSYIPDIILSTREMNFWHRLLNVAIHCVEWTYYYYKYIPAQKQIYYTYFPNATLTFEEAQRRFALVLLNDHFSLTQARPYVPNMIEVAGLNLNINPQPLAQDIKDLLDNARQGVIVVDLELDFNITKVFLKQFRKMPYLIMWQTAQDISDMPRNVFINNSLNLPSIMGHSNVKLHILPATFFRAVESVYYGRPILGIAGQEIYCGDYIKKIGIGITLKLNSISEMNLARAFHELLNTNYYANMAKTLSLRFRDQQNTPMERAIYWTEYVLRHNGASHLKNRGQNLTWWQFYNIDVWAVMLSLITLIIALALLVLKLITNLTWNMKYGKNVAVSKKDI